MRIAATFFLIGLLAVPLSAQAQGRSAQAQNRSAQNRNGAARAQGIPPGHVPPPGQCRVWYEDRAPGRQPGPTNCDNAERIASRSRDARVIYGPDRNVRDNRRDKDRRDNDRRDDRDRQGVNGIRRVPFDNGYRDGLEKGREDARDNDDYDPVRHSWYRSGTRGYDDRHGNREQYRHVYREGFESGYAEAFRGRIYFRRR